MVDHTDQLVIATTALGEHAEAGALLLEALMQRDAHSARLARDAVVIVSQSERTGPASEVQRVAKGFEPLARRAVTIPFDPEMHGGRLAFERLSSKTRRAWLHAAAAVAEAPVNGFCGLSQVGPTARTLDAPLDRDYVSGQAHAPDLGVDHFEGTIVKTISTPSASFLTGTAIADAVQQYALELARARQVDTVDIPVVLTDGADGRASFMVGWLIDTAATMTADASEQRELVDDATVSELRSRCAFTASPTALAFSPADLAQDWPELDLDFAPR
jgi:hypothetical protein